VREPGSTSVPDPTSDLPHGVSRSTASGWIAWIVLGALLLILLGCVHLLTGLAALLRPEILASTRSHLLIPIGLEALAWLHVALGAIAVIVGFSLLRGRRWARWSAVLLALLAMLVNFAFIAVYPIWAVLAIAFAAIVIYAVVVHGSEMADAYSGP
jgi:hypothetical protein